MMTAKQLAAQVERMQAKAVGRTEKEIVAIYAAVRDEMRLELAKTYERYSIDGKLTTGQMTKYNRAVNLEKELTSKLAAADRKVIAVNNRLTAEQYGAAFFGNAWAIDMELEARVKWGKIADSAVRAAVENPMREIADSRLRTSGRQKIRTAIAGGLARGDSYAKMATELRGAITGSRVAAVRIARTEAHRAQSLGTIAAYDKAATLGIAGNEYWVATVDGRTRDRHGDLDGKAKNLEHNGWYAGNGVWTRGPSLSGIASFDINCRCRVEYRVNNEAPSVRRIRGRGVVPYQTYEDWMAAA